MRVQESAFGLLEGLIASGEVEKKGLAVLRGARWCKLKTRPFALFHAHVT